MCHGTKLCHKDIAKVPKKLVQEKVSCPIFSLLNLRGQRCLDINLTATFEQLLSRMNSPVRLMSRQLWPGKFNNKKIGHDTFSWNKYQKGTCGIEVNFRLFVELRRG
jgi:hypothetical protein